MVLHICLDWWWFWFGSSNFITAEEEEEEEEDEDEEDDVDEDDDEQEEEDDDDDDDPRIVELRLQKMRLYREEIKEGRRKGYGIKTDIRCLLCLSSFSFFLLHSSY